MTRSALVLTAPDRFVVEARSATPPDAGQVSVEVDLVGLCGTDLHIVDGAHPRAKFPLILGHEILGRATIAGSPNVRVVVDPLIACTVCTACRSGNPHICERLRLIGIDSDGGLGGDVAVDVDRLHPVPPQLDPAIAALAEPTAVAVHAVDRAGVRAGHGVVIFGAGPIGLLLGLVARSAGAGDIFMAEPSATRRAQATALGFATLDPAAPYDDLVARTGGNLADVAFDAAAAPAVAAMLPHVVRTGGTVSLVGTYSRPVELDLQAVLFRELTLIGNRVYRPPDIDTALLLLAKDPDQYRPLVTDTVPLADAPAAIARLRSGDGVKYLVSVGSA